MAHGTMHKAVPRADLHAHLHARDAVVLLAIAMRGLGVDYQEVGRAQIRFVRVLDLRRSRQLMHHRFRTVAAVASDAARQYRRTSRTRPTYLLLELTVCTR